MTALFVIPAKAGISLILPSVQGLKCHYRRGQACLPRYPTLNKKWGSIMVNGKNETYMDRLLKNKDLKGHQ